MANDWQNAARWVKHFRTKVTRPPLSIRDACAEAGFSLGVWVNAEKGVKIGDISQGKISAVFDWPPDAWERMLDGLPPVPGDDELRPSAHAVQRDYNSDIAELPPDAQEFIDQVIERERRKQRG